jgi:hypothetical protein
MLKHFDIETTSKITSIDRVFNTTSIDKDNYRIITVNRMNDNFSFLDEYLPNNGQIIMP